MVKADVIYYPLGFYMDWPLSLGQGPAAEEEEVHSTESGFFNTQAEKFNQESFVGFRNDCRFENRCVM